VPSLATRLSSGDGRDWRELCRKMSHVKRKRRRERERERERSGCCARTGGCSFDSTRAGIAPRFRERVKAALVETTSFIVPVIIRAFSPATAGFAGLPFFFSSCCRTLPAPLFLSREKETPAGRYFLRGIVDRREKRRRKKEKRAKKKEEDIAKRQFACSK